MNIDKTCRFCSHGLSESFCDLGLSPLSNAYRKKEDLQSQECFYPLHAYVCSECYLVQLQEFESPAGIFSDYAYFSSYSTSWLEHASNYTEMMIKRFRLGTHTQVIEIASNDGYLLQYFKKHSIPILGIEPAENVAKVASIAGIPTLTKFFGTKTALELVQGAQSADVLLGNNVLAHVPDLNDFVKGLKILLKSAGVITLEFPHLLQLMQNNQFDTIYHEHFSYFSLITLQKVFEAHGLELFDVEELPTHGGSLRIFVKHQEDQTKNVFLSVQQLIDREIGYGLREIATYQAFSEKTKEIRQNLLSFLSQVKNEGKTIVGYGAPAKGNTLLNYCGIRPDSIDYTVDLSPHKQGLYLPGTHIPIRHPDYINETKPNYVLILPWNLKEEIMEQMQHVRIWGCKFVVPIPAVEVLN